MLKQKNRETGITLIALIVTIIVLIILAGVSIAMLVGDNGIITKAQEAKKDTEQAQQDELQGLSNLETAIEEALGNVYDKEKEVNKPKLAQGMTPIKFTTPTDTEKGAVVETTSNDADWYEYGTEEDTKKWANAITEDGSMWVWIPRFAYRVNSSTQTFDVVFLVGTTDQYYDDNGVLQTAKRCTSEDELVDTSTGYTVHPAFTDETAINYRNGGWDKEITGIWVAKFEAGYASGNNDAEVVASSVNYTLTTAWVPDVESGETTTNNGASKPARNWLDGEYGTTTTTIKYPVFQPITYTMNYITHNDAYNIAKALTENGNIYGFTGAADSHLMKNSEWGAVAYLSKSKYGLGSTDITVNNISLNSGNDARSSTAGKTGVESVYAVTGCTSNSTSATTRTTTIETINATTGNTANGGVYTWNQKTGATASCTGSIYGIYDLSGGAWERTTGYVANQNSNLSTYGRSIAYDENNLRTISTKYTTVYPHNSETDKPGITDISNDSINLNIASNNNYALNTLIYGDAIRETSTAGTGNTSWYREGSGFPGLNVPFTFRGGSYYNGSAAGLFYFSRGNGDSSSYDGFRATVIIP